MENKAHKKFERAQRRIAQIKGFYNHVLVFVIFNTILLMSQDKMAIALFGQDTIISSKAMSWIDWNIYIWGAILAVHALFVFGNIPFFVKKWEERQIKKYMSETNE